ncbi:family 1 encapsulin nanocompartment shell protein [Sporichthya polymorpha]|uniref:family 1 encapsulin nanocompartment shell protein n=1 Tax=Sporichthya polymorpha TaxID=35751 RepID=UPI000377D149|nr:family 1 encapsulin nanocompartment shell protein [Sporichthya polymorpha]
MTDHLLRNLAPIPDTAWKLIDDEAKERLTPKLAARRLVDWKGPRGWGHSATNLGRVRRLAPAGDAARGEEVDQRMVLPVTEFRVPFTVKRAEIADAARGAVDLDLDDLARAAARAAECENTAVLHGWATAGIVGLTEASTHDPLPLGEDAMSLPHTVAVAVDRLRCAGIEGPYALAIAPAGYTRIVETTEQGGHPLLDHLRQILGGDVIWAPGVEGAVVLSRRGGDFVLDVGQDLAIGYRTHDAETVELYLEESFSFRVIEPDAALALR